MSSSHRDLTLPLECPFCQPARSGEDVNSEESADSQVDARCLTHIALFVDILLQYPPTHLI